MPITNQRKINVLFLVPSLRRGGAETQLVSVINGISNRAINKFLVSFETGIDQLVNLDENEVRYFHFTRKKKLDLSVAKNIARVIDDNQIEVVHCTLQMAFFMGWIARRISERRPKLIVAIHTTKHRSMRDAFIDHFIYAPLLSTCDKVIFVCKTQASHWVQRHRKLRDKYVVIYNGVDSDHFDPVQVEKEGIEFRSAYGIPEGAEVITCIAGFRKEKGHAFLIETFGDIHRDAYLVLVGDGVLRKDLEKHIGHLGISSRVIMLGEVSDVRPALAASDVTVIPSTAETFSMAVLESMSMGTPVVATDVGGLGEAIEPGINGELVASGNSDDLQKALCKVLDEPHRKEAYGKAARLNIIDHFNKVAMISQTERLLLDLAT